jgi:hypothetical protein
MTRLDALDATLTNGRFELPAHARGVLILADPPEAGWRIQSPSNKPATGETRDGTNASRAAR